MRTAVPIPRSEEERAFFASIELSPIATVITDCRMPDNPIVAVNASFCALTGYEPAEAIGRNCRFLAGPGTDPSARSALRQAVKQRQPALVELLNFRKDGSAFRNAVMIAPFRDLEGSVAFFVGSQMNVAEGAAETSAGRRRRARLLIDALTPRQRQVLEWMIQGYRNKQIAAELGIDEKTVKMHRAGMLQRLGAGGSADAIRLAVEAGLGQ